MELDPLFNYEREDFLTWLPGIGVPDDPHPDIENDYDLVQDRHEAAMQDYSAHEGRGNGKE